MFIRINILHVYILFYICLCPVFSTESSAYSDWWTCTVVGIDVAKLGRRIVMGCRLSQNYNSLATSLAMFALYARSTILRQTAPYTYRANIAKERSQRIV